MDRYPVSSSHQLVDVTLPYSRVPNTSPRSICFCEEWMGPAYIVDQVRSKQQAKAKL